MLREAIREIINATGYYRRKGRTLDYTRDYIESNKRNKDIVNAPDFHLTAPIGWLNDPNGFIFFKGKYHQFYQYYPFDTYWGPMYWGHAVSNDLITWEHMPVAMAPDTDADKGGVWSGSTIDKDGKLYVMYSGNLHKGQVQNIAYSDNTIDFHKYEGNPVMTADHLPRGGSKINFRDPKIWFEDGKYYAVIASKVKGKPVVLRFVSDDIYRWEYHSTLHAFDDKYMRECPDYFELDSKKVLLYSSKGGESEWIVGREENGTLIEEARDSIDQGLDFYAPQTLDANGRRIMTAWMHNWDREVITRKYGYAGSMIIPRELTIRDGRIWMQPVRELDSYRYNKLCYNNLVIGEEVALNNLAGNSIDMVMDVKLQKDSVLSMVFNKTGTEFIELLICDESVDLLSSSTNDKGKEITNMGIIDDTDMSKNIRIIIDKYAFEIFVNGKCMSFNIQSKTKDYTMTLTGKNNPVVNIEKYDLRR